MLPDPRRLADFWATALALSERRDEEGETIVSDADWNYPRLTFQKVAESPTRAPRLHLDLTASDWLAEVRRLRELGARDDRSVTVDGDWTWTVMMDPDGNEFCVTDP